MQHRCADPPECTRLRQAFAFSHHPSSKCCVCNKTYPLPPLFFHRRSGKRRLRYAQRATWKFRQPCVPVVSPHASLYPCTTSAQRDFKFRKPSFPAFLWSQRKQAPTASIFTRSSWPHRRCLCRTAKNDGMGSETVQTCHTEAAPIAPVSTRSSWPHRRCLCRTVPQFHSFTGAKGHF